MGYIKLFIMIRSKLKNGITLLFEERKSGSIVIALQVNVGSNNEDDSNKGISHFIEHMVFEGTKNRTPNEISNDIERLGGELNAYTSHDRTVFYTIVPKKYFDVGINVIADIIQNSDFNKKAIKKEKRVVIDEINLIHDDPKFYQFVFFLKHLYKKHPIMHPISGYKETINKLTRKGIINYYKKHYVPDNMIITVIGDVNDLEKKIKNKFENLKEGKIKRQLFFNEPLNERQETFTEERKISQSYLVFGYKVPYRTSKESYAVDIIRAVLAKGQSARLFNELRTKRGLCYIVGAHYESGLDYGYFSIFVGTDKKNIEIVVNIIKKEMKRLKKLNDKEIKEAKTFIEGSFVIENEDPKKLADNLLFWNQIDYKFKLDDYIKNIRKITREDIKNISNKYFGDNYLLTILKQV